MEREQFVRENPELALKQKQEGNKGTLRIIAIVSLGAAAIFGTYRYCNDGSSEGMMNVLPQKSHNKSSV